VFVCGVLIPKSKKKNQFFLLFLKQKKWYSPIKKWHFAHFCHIIYTIYNYLII